MGKEIVMFGNIEVEKHKFHQHKGSISIHDVNVVRMVVFNKIPFSKKDLNILLDRKMILKKITFVSNASKS